MMVRRHQRLPVAIPVILVHAQRERLRYTGTVKDLSRQGCRIESVIRPFTGMQMELHLQPPGESSPIIIRNAAVRWTGNLGIGLEFLAVTPSQQERLNRLLERLSNRGRDLRLG
ncbi:MAG: PilZ domain-containing protein [Nitrospira sp.]|nr:PilZ domain-containing protein [Nitrospira sp.]MCP9441469.1 PilZ domain-containing protein [Nitrospira sp.]